MIYVDDIDPRNTFEETYDLAVFASGYEARCTHIARKLNKTKIKQSLIWGFDLINKGTQRLKNDKYFSIEWSRYQNEINANDDGPIYEELREALKKKSDKLRLVVDYSSMSRLWYNAILNWAILTDISNIIEIDFLYSLGKHEGELPFYTIEDILPLPGCEGGALRFGEAIAIFGLGKYGVMAQSVFENLEPDRIFTYIASPGAYAKYAEEVMRNNQFIIEHSSGLLELPLKRVQLTLRYLTDFVSPFLKRDEIILIPMGPKPHVLAAMLLSLRYKEIACLRVSAKRKRAEKVEPTGGIIGTKVIINKRLNWKNEEKIRGKEQGQKRTGSHLK